MQLLYYNIILFLIILFLLFLIKAHALSKFSLSLWIFSGINTIIYSTVLLGGFVNFNIWPVLFLDICILIYIYPLTRIRILKLNISSYTVKNIEYLMLLLGIMSILPFIEHLIYMFNTFSVASNSIVDMYEDKMDGKSNIITWLDPLAFFFYGIIGNFRYIMVFLLFILFCKKRKIENWKLLLYCIAVLNPIIGSINTSGRGAFFFFLITLVILYLLMRESFIIKISRTLKLAFVSIIVLFASAVILITILRNDGAEYDAWIWSSLYFGEGQVNFFQDMWNIRTYTQGDNSFSYFKYILGLDTFKDYLDRREFWNISKTGVDPVRFYTFIGDWFSDIGYYTILLIFILSIWIYYIIKRKKYTLTSLYIIYIYIYIICTSFTCYSLKSYFNTYHIVLGGIFLFIMTKFKLTSKNYKNGQS